MNAKKHPALSAALANPESDVAQPSRRRSSSFQAQVNDLEPGETAAQPKRMDQSLPLEKLRDVAADARITMRNGLNQVVKRAREATGGEYTVEISDMITADRNWFVVALVSRIS